MATTKWVIDPGHSEIQFKVKHLAIANVSGSFKTFQGTVESDDENFDHAKISFEIETESIDTNNKDRDVHLRSDNFLNAIKYPKIAFNGDLQEEDGDYKLIGNLTILETTKQIILAVEHTGTGKGRFNDIRSGFEITGKLNRKDFGLNFNLLTEVGNMVVGEEVKLLCTVELIKQ